MHSLSPMQARSAVFKTTSEEHDAMNQHSVEFIAAGGNRHPSAADWDPASGVLAFASDNNIALWNPLDEDYKGIYSLLCAHQGAVTCVKFYRDLRSNTLFILSGSEDKSVRFWKQDKSALTSFNVAKVVHVREKTVNCLSALPDCGIFAVGYASPNVDLFRLKVNESSDSLSVDHLQGLNLHPKYFPLAIAFICLPLQRAPLLAVAGSGHVIHLFTEEESGFRAVATLTGHESWIRSLDFESEGDHQGNDILLSSASQDKYIRLWRVHAGEQLPAVSVAAQDPVLGSVGKSLSNKAQRFTIGETHYSVTFEALLIGHEDWVYTSRWFKHREGLRLLTSSADNSLAMWEADPTSGVWICNVRLGSISAQKGATTATGSTGGFWIGLWSPRGDAVVSLGRTGAWRVWKHDPKDGTWVQDVAVTGHTKGVRDICWSHDGDYLFSTSSDQTTRLWAEWKRPNKTSWNEFSRPQIHGYDLNSIDVINDSRIISGADEKLLRVFDEPLTVANALSTLAGVTKPNSNQLPATANIPVLGLSNKVLNSAEEGSEETGGASGAVIEDPHKELDVTTPPLEDDLARNLLWPEIEKLYGHGYEISTVAAAHDGTIVATACRASSMDHAVIRLFETDSWREIKPPLSLHTLTVTSLSFSPDDQYLVSAGRDRQCAVFERGSHNPWQYELRAFNPKAHTRMLLGTSWAPLISGRKFATAGRDKTVRFWELRGKEIVQLFSLASDQPVTALSFAPYSQFENVPFVYGLEDGALWACELSIENMTPVTPPRKFPPEISPSNTITAISWRPKGPRNQPQELGNGSINGAAKSIVAVASEDSSIRLYHIGQT